MEKNKNSHIDHFYNHIEEIVIIVCLGFMTIITFINIVTRYFLSFTFSWGEQFTRILFVWLTFAGISYCAMKLSHLKVNAIELLLPKKVGIAISIFGQVVSIAYCLFACALISRITIYDIQTWQTFAAIPTLPVWIMYFPGVIFTIGFCIRTIQSGIIPEVKLFRGEN